MKGMRYAVVGAALLGIIYGCAGPQTERDWDAETARVRGEMRKQIYDTDSSDESPLDPVINFHWFNPPMADFLSGMQGAIRKDGKKSAR